MYIHNLFSPFSAKVRASDKDIPVTYGDASKWRDVSTGASGTTSVASKFSVTLTLFKPGGGGQILPTIAEVGPKISLWIRP